MKKIYLFVLIVFASSVIFAQTDWETKREKFDEKTDPAKDLKLVVAKAQKENKRIILDVGGEWCKWCHRLDIFILSDNELKKTMDENFITLKVNYSKDNKNEKFLSSYPKVDGYPHMFVLEKDGKLLHSQNTGLLEDKESYSKEKIMEFLKKWSVSKS